MSRNPQSRNTQRTPKPPPSSSPNPVEVNPDTEMKLDELGQELLVEKEKRNYFQLERDKINGFWEITKRDLEAARAELRNKEREMEEMEERHQVELKVYKQKVRYLLYEQKVTIDRLKIESENALKLQQDEYRQKLAQLKTDKRALKQDMRMRDIAHEEKIKALKNQHDRNITKLRQEFERNLKEVQMRYEKKMKTLRDDMELQRKNEIEELQERKNSHIKELMKKHADAFSEIKSYFHLITSNNLLLIKSLKDKANKMEKNDADNEKLMFEIAQENKKLAEPLMGALLEVDKLRHDLANYQKDKLSLTNAKSRLQLLEDQLKSLTWEHEVLQQRFSHVQRERDELYGKFESTIHEVQQRTGFKNILLEKKLEAVTDALEKKDTQIVEVLKAANLSPEVYHSVNAKVDSVIDEKNRQLKDLQLELAKVTKAHNDAIRVYESKMVEYGIPPEELGFVPLIISSTTQTSGPAGLVSG